MARPAVPRAAVTGAGVVIESSDVTTICAGSIDVMVNGLALLHLSDTSSPARTSRAPYAEVDGHARGVHGVVGDVQRDGAADPAHLAEGVGRCRRP